MKMGCSCRRDLVKLMIRNKSGFVHGKEEIYHGIDGRYISTPQTVSK